MDDIATGLDAYDATFERNTTYLLWSEVKRLHYVVSINSVKLSSIEAKIKPLLINEDHTAF